MKLSGEPMSGGFWLVHKNKGFLEFYSKDFNVHNKGAVRDVYLIMIKIYGFNENEIDIAIEEMLKNKHNAAHFGMNGNFIFTKTEAN